MDNVPSLLNISSLLVFVLGLIAAIVAWYRPTQRSQALSYVVLGGIVACTAQIARIVLSTG